MVTISEWLRDWRTIVGGLEDGSYQPIMASHRNHAGRRFEVLRVSKFDREIDGSKSAIQTSSSAFEDSTALLCHLTRDAGIVRVVTTKGRPWFILEPGEEVLDWAAAVEDVSQKELEEVTAIVLAIVLELGAETALVLGELAARIEVLESAQKR